MSFHKPAVRVRVRNKYKIAPKFTPDNTRRISFKNLKKQEEKQLPKGNYFNVFLSENWLI